MFSNLQKIQYRYQYGSSESYLGTKWWGAHGIDAAKHVQRPLRRQMLKGRQHFRPGDGNNKSGFFLIMSDEKDEELFSKFIDLTNHIDDLVRKGNVEGVKSELDDHPEILNCNFFHTGKYGLLNFAALQGDLNLCRMLVERGIDIDVSPDHVDTPLGVAASHGHLDVVKWLMENGARIDSFPTSITTPLMNAITFGHNEVAKYLIKNGSDVNRLHARLHQTSLDLAIVWGRDDIADILRSKFAISTLAEMDCSKEYGAPIIQCVSEAAGRVLPIQLVKIIEDISIGQRIAIVNKGKNKLLFTVGLFSVNLPMLELFIVLPIEWNLNDRSPQSQFPSSLLIKISGKIRNGLKIEEGFCIKADDPDYETLPWPTGVAGFFVCNHYWGRDREVEEFNKDENVSLLTLIPVKKTKAGFPAQSIDKNRQAGWAKLTLNI